MIKEEARFISSTVFEGMTSIRALLDNLKANVSNARKIDKILYDGSKSKGKAKEIGYLKKMAELFSFEIEEVDSDTIDTFTVGNSHGGIIALCQERKYSHICPESIVDNGFYVMIEGIEDPYNFGYSLRSLYAMGCSGVILTERNWMSAAGVVCRSSAGASEMFMMYKSSPQDCVKIFKERGYKVVCADENTDNILGECELKMPLLLIVGGEKRGISRSVIDSADILVKIGYGREFKASLSAASATTMFA